MNINNKNTTADKNAGSPVSRSDTVKIQLTHFSKSKIELLHTTAAYSSTSSKIKIQRNINWHESEWPDLPKPGLSSSECDRKFQGNNKLLQAGSSSSHHEILSKEGDKDFLKNEVFRESCHKKCSLQDREECKIKSLHTTQKNFTCTTRGVDEITCSLTTLTMSNKCYQSSAVTSLESANLMPECLESRHLCNQKNKGKMASGTSVENHSGFKLNQGALFISQEEGKICKILSPLCDDDFPDLSTKKATRKAKKSYPSSVQDPTAKKLTKKYPRSNDPIFINLGEVLEHSSSSEKCKSLLRNRYYQGFWPGNARTDSSRHVVKRGKQREFPKRKPLTKLKMAILRERQQRLKSRLLTSRSIQDSGSPNHSFTDYLKTVPPGTLREDLTSDRKERQTSQQEENVDSKNCLEFCSSGGFDLVDIQNQSDLDETDNGKLSSAGKVEGRRNESFNPFTELSLNLIHCADENLQLAKASIHSRKFREYCNNDNCAALEDKVKAFVKQIYRFQTNSHFRDAEKARIHRRYVLGLREADKYFKLRKLKVLIIATDLEANSEKGGLDEIIENMKSRGDKENLPVIFALRRRDLAYCVYRKVPVSCMAVLNFEGAEEQFRAVIDAWKDASAAYDKKLTEASSLSSKQISECRRKASDNVVPMPADTADAIFLTEGSEKENPTCTQEAEDKKLTEASSLSSKQISECRRKASDNVVSMPADTADAIFLTEGSEKENPTCTQLPEEI